MYSNRWMLWLELNIILERGVAVSSTQYIHSLQATYVFCRHKLVHIHNKANNNNSNRNMISLQPPFPLVCFVFKSIFNGKRLTNSNGLGNNMHS